MSLRAQVLAALDTVYDPELDEPIAALGFVASCAVSDAGDIEVRLRLPTSQCAPNFAYLMAADSREALCRVPGVQRVSVVLDGHYTGDEINATVARGGDFDDAFPGETAGSLDALRELFRRKALVGRQGRACQALLAGGATVEDVAGLRVAELPADADVTRCLALRRELGLPHGRDDAAFVGGDGTALTAASLPAWLRRARLMTLSLESNGELCRSLLNVRYGGSQSEEVAA
ncbi:MAG: iron-sulfur cluster assembly protein [Actinomycetota bacterium]|nr:iron-sulfur cluster assembly protein [Actinomycetota bacterium]